MAWSVHDISKFILLYNIELKKLKLKNLKKAIKEILNTIHLLFCSKEKKTESMMVRSE